MGGWTPRWVFACDRPDRVILLTLLIGLLGYIDADANLGGCIVGLLAKDSTVDNPESRNKNGATEEGAIFTPRSVRLYKGMLIASIDFLVIKMGIACQMLAPHRTIFLQRYNHCKCHR